MEARRQGTNGHELSHELDQPPWLRVEATLMAAARSIREGYDDRLRPIGLTLSTASLLAYVQQFGPVNQSRAAEHLGQGRAATGNQVDQLERRGLLRRTADSGDRRAWLVEVTPEGAALVERVNTIDEFFRDQLRVGISRADRQQLASLLVRLQRNLTDANQPSNPASDQTSGKDAALPDAS